MSELTAEEITPVRIPGYRIKSMIGRGGTAKVYRAVQESLDREVALKVMSPSLAMDPIFCERFRKEGRIIEQLSSHQDIVTIFSIGRFESHYYMAMEFIGGSNLERRIRREDSIANPLYVIRRIAGALSFAHSQGFVHRDVKPANILFRKNGAPVLTDFGIAKSLGFDSKLTRAGHTVGTPEYMSPEQATGRTLDSRSDLYSLGVVLYEILTKRQPFVGEDPLDTAQMHVKKPVPMLPKEAACYQGIIDRLLAKNPNDRFSSAEDLIERIDEMASAVGRLHSMS